MEERRESGLTTEDWCKQNNVRVSTLNSAGTRLRKKGYNIPVVVNCRAQSSAEKVTEASCGNSTQNKQYPKRSMQEWLREKSGSSPVTSDVEKSAEAEATTTYHDDCECSDLELLQLTGGRESTNLPIGGWCREHNTDITAHCATVEVESTTVLSDNSHTIEVTINDVCLKISNSADPAILEQVLRILRET